MKTANSAQYKTVLEQIKDWPAGERLALAQGILRTLRPELVEGNRRGGTLDIALGLLATGKPAPTDETVQEWLSNQRKNGYD